jgi:dihydrolipoamide dehydrogenase
VKTYDVIVVGAGDVGLGVAFEAVSGDLNVALVDKGHPGGTCVNSGCVPSKTLIYTADRITETRENAKLGIRSGMIDVNFRAVMERTRRVVARGRNSIKKALKGSGNIEFINKEARFIDEHTLEAGGRKIRGKQIFLATGARPLVPQIKGLDKTPFLTNESVLGLASRPDSIILIGGGFISLEYAHFFSALGVKVKLIDRNPALLPLGEPEISRLLKQELEKRIELHMGVETMEIQRGGNGYTVLVKDVRTGRRKRISASHVMVNAGRKSNADLLKPENAGIETDNTGFIKVDKYLRTNKKHIWALGDAIGRKMFTHAGDKEAELAWHNARHKKQISMDFESVPYAVYTHPQIASVGLTELQARHDHEILVGRTLYSDTVMGEAMMERTGFAKAVVEKGTRRILGFHITGPHAATLIQEVANAIIHKADVESITGCMHIFPALSNIVPATFDNLE